METPHRCRLLSRSGERSLAPGSELVVGDSPLADWRLAGLEPAHARFAWEAGGEVPRVFARGPVSIDAARVLREGPLRHGAQVRLGAALIRVLLVEARAGLGAASPSGEFAFRRPGQEECLRELRRTLGAQAPRLWAQAAARAGVEPERADLRGLHAILSELESEGGLAQIAALSLQIRLRTAEADAAPLSPAPIPVGLEAGLDAVARRRLEEVSRLRLLDPEVAPMLAALTSEASAAFGLPIGLVSVVLDSAQYFPGGTGLAGWLAEASGTPSEWAFCRHVVDGAEILVVEDARDDPWVRANPLVTRDGIGCYAGASLRTSRDVPIGSFCVIGAEARTFSAAELELLRSYAARAMQALESRVAG